MVASGAVCGDAFPGNGLPVRGLWSLIPVLVAFPLILCQQPPVTDRLPRHSIRISSNRGLYCILLCRFRQSGVHQISSGNQSVRYAEKCDSRQAKRLP